MPQIAAEVLGIPVDRISLRLGDTDLPETGGTVGSSTTMSTGSAVADASRAPGVHRVSGLAAVRIEGHLTRQREGSLGAELLDAAFA
jgi:CO/xanthine dehydrogenase Mo-binding subunit